MPNAAFANRNCCKADVGAKIDIRTFLRVRKKSKEDINQLLGPVLRRNSVPEHIFVRQKAFVLTVANPRNNFVDIEGVGHTIENVGTQIWWKRLDVFKQRLCGGLAEGVVGLGPPLKIFLIFGLHDVMSCVG